MGSIQSHEPLKAENFLQLEPERRSSRENLQNLRICLNSKQERDSTHRCREGHPARRLLQDCPQADSAPRNRALHGSRGQRSERAWKPSFLRASREELFPVNTLISVRPRPERKTQPSHVGILTQGAEIINGYYFKPLSV